MKLTGDQKAAIFIIFQMNVFNPIRIGANKVGWIATSRFKMSRIWAEVDAGVGKNLGDLLSRLGTGP